MLDFGVFLEAQQKGFLVRMWGMKKREESRITLRILACEMGRIELELSFTDVGKMAE